MKERLDIGRKLHDETQNLRRKKEVESALKRERDYLENVLENSADAIGIVDGRGRFVRWNKRAAELFGYSFEDLHDKKAYDLYEDRHELHSVIRELKQRGFVRNRSMMFRTSGQKLIELEISISLLKDERGRSIGSVCVARDPSEMRRTQAALRESQERYKAIVENSDSHIYIVSQDYSIEFVNSTWVRRLGYNPMQKGEKCYEAMAKRSTPCPECQNARVFAGESLKFEKHLPDGSIFEFYNAPIYHNNGGISKMSVGTEVTEQRALQERIFHAQQMEAMGTLAGGIAHDFNNLLAAILGNISVAQLQMDPDDPASRTLEKSKEACVRARDLTQQLITFAKGGEPSRKPRQISGLVEAAVELALSGSSIDCHVRLPEDLWPVECDYGQIHQVFNNLALNARDAMAEGGTLEIEAANVLLEEGRIPELKSGRYVSISVRDHGMGIAPEHLSRIFDPYFSTKQRGAQKGMGLGLTIVHSIVKRHEGTVTVDSTLGKGTVFRVHLPASRVEPTVAPHEQASAPSGEGRVLIMDDEEMIRDMAAEMLKHLGYEVEVASNGDEAVARYTQELHGSSPFDVVLLDLTVRGGMGGKEALRELLRVDSSVKTVVTSGYSNDPAMSRHREFGFSGKLTKPFQIQKLGETLQEVLSQKD